MRKFFYYGLLIFIGIFFIGCGQKKEIKGGKLIRIALVCPLTGDVAAMGQGMKNASTLAIEEANAKIPIKDTRFELLALDDRADPKEAVNAAYQIVSDKTVYGVVGHLNSGCSIPASAVYSRHNLVMISPASTNPKLTLQGFKNVFRTCATDDVQGSFAANFIYKNRGIRQAVIIHDKTPYGQGLAEEFKKTFQELGGVVLSFEGVNLGDRDFKALLIKLNEMVPGVIYFGGMYQEGGLISKQAKELGLSVPLAGGDGIFTNEYIKIAAGASEGDMATMIGSPPKKMSGAGDFIEKYKLRFPDREMQPYDPYTYDTVNIIIEAIKGAGMDRVKIIEQVKTISYDGIIGTTRFDEKGDTLNKEISCYYVKDGKWLLAE